MSALNKLLLRWRGELVDPLPPEDATAVHEAFAQIGAVVTTDVVALYAAIGGMRMMDDEYWRLWPIAEIREGQPSEWGVVFSDYCLDCWQYRLKPVSTEVSAVYLDLCDGKPCSMVARSLEEFFELYVVNARALLDAQSVQ